ncbi:TetR/AcrR family transcriptional regulator [Brevibacillus sp. SYSU BS000544]|uniref:TetR/AcrR family transcriptional regulator n=1 Tax=Brevibacillus sp. SYSU BS000544 TaxID=3416443 RepID=UPI003CE4614E
MKRSSNRIQIITTASDLFLQKGLANTSMDDVVAKSGVSKSNIYYHFKSKEELTGAVLAHRMNLLQDTLGAILHSRELTVAERIKRIFTTLAAELEGRSCVGGCPVFSLLSANVPDIKMRINLFLEEMKKIAEKLLSEGIAQGEFKADISIFQTATLLVTVLEGSIMLAEAQGDSTVLINAGNTFLHLLKV